MADILQSVRLNKRGEALRAINFLRLGDNHMQVQRWQPLYTKESCRPHKNEIQIPAIKAAYGRVPSPQNPHQQSQLDSNIAPDQPED